MNTEITTILRHAIQNNYELIFHDPHKNTVSLINGDEIIITEPFKAPDRFQNGIYFVVSAIREDYIKFRLAHPKCTSAVAATGARYLLLIDDDAVSIPVNKDNVFELFVDLFGVEPIDFTKLDEVVKYNYELKLAIMRMRKELDSLESLIQ